MRMNPLVAPAWLAARLDDPDTVILDATLPPVGVTPSVHPIKPTAGLLGTPAVDTRLTPAGKGRACWGPRARYLAQHIPGALFFDIDELSDHATALPHMLPTAEAFASSMSAMGVADRQCIVVYEQEGVFSAPRAWWMLRTFGAGDVHVLDGGLRAWIEGGFPTESGSVQRAPANFAAELDRNAVKDFPQIQELIAEGAAQGPQLQSSKIQRSKTPGPQILDARSAGRFTGSAPDPRPGVSSGHMPGAINVHYAELAEGGRMKPAERLRKLFKAKGVDIDKPITTTCGSGVTAAVISLALEICGAGRVSLYDGSWAEYAQQPGAVIEKTG